MFRIVLLTVMTGIGLPLFAATVTTTPGCTTGVAGITSTITFTGAIALDPAGHATYTGAQFNNGSNPCGSDFLATAGSPTTITFDQPIDYFGLAWGTPDPNNDIQLFNGATSVFFFQGTTAPSNNYLNFFADPGEQFTRVVLSYESCCFETDNHSYRLAGVGAAAPEPCTLTPLVVVGLSILTWRALLKRPALRADS